MSNTTAGHLDADPDGKYVRTNAGTIYTNQLKTVAAKTAGRRFPAVEGDYYLVHSPTTRYHSQGRGKRERLPTFRTSSPAPAAPSGQAAQKKRAALAGPGRLRR